MMPWRSALFAYAGEEGVCCVIPFFTRLLERGGRVRGELLSFGFGLVVNWY